MYLETNDKSQCYGCKVCAEICPQKCITFMEDFEHFLYPVIDNEKCVKCRLCQKVCPAENKSFHKKQVEGVYVGKYRSEKVLFNSSSGGAFTAIYKILINKGYTVCGVRWSEDYKVIHDLAINETQCEAFRKSKYIMSDTNHSFDKIKKILLGDGKVLFTGTPCQCAALLSFLKLLKINCENLIVVDIICHGAPNQYVFDKYIGEKNSNSSKQYSFEFKSKRKVNGKSNSRTASLVDENGNVETLTINNDPFLKGYYGRLFYRPSCASCNFALPERVSDITIGDAWHIEEIYPEWNSLEGISLLLVNSEKGKVLFDEIINNNMMEVKKVDLEWAIKNNSQLREPTQMHPNREKFFKLIDKNSFKKSVDCSIKISFYKKILAKLKKVFV